MDRPTDDCKGYLLADCAPSAVTVTGGWYLTSACCTICLSDFGKAGIQQADIADVSIVTVVMLQAL